MTSSWHHHDIITFWDFAPSAYEWCAFLDSSKGPQPNETWQDCPHHGGESSTQSKPSNLFTSRTSNQQRMWAYVSSASFALSKHSHPQRVSKHSEVFSIHLGRPHINLPKHVITVTKNFAAQNHDTGSDASFPRVGEVWGLPNSSWPASHFLITLEQKTWHHHDIIMTSSHFGTLHHQPMSGVHSWTHQKGLSRTRPDKIVLIMEVKVQHNQKPSNLFTSRTSNQQRMWAYVSSASFALSKHSHPQRVRKHSEVFSIHLGRPHINLPKHVITVTKNVAAQNHDTGSDASFPGVGEVWGLPNSSLPSLSFFDHFGAEDVTSSWHHHILGLCTISLWVVCILGLIKRASAERDLTRLSSSWRWKFNTIKTKQSLHKPNQQPAENVSICELSIIRTFKTLTPTKGQETFWGFLNSSRPSTYQSAKACHHRDQELCSSESWHRFRRLIPRGRRSLRLTQFIFASISFFDHFGAEDVTSSWHHHDIITFWDFAPSAYEWCAFLDSSKGPQPNETWQDCPHHGGESSTQSKPSNLFTSRTSNQQRMWAYVSSASFALSKHSHPQRVSKHSEVFSIHLGRPHINLPKHVITVTKNFAAQNHDTGSDASFPRVGEVWGLPNSSWPASHFLITLEQKTWHHHDIIMTSSHFGTLHHQPMSGVHSWTHQKGLSRTRPDKIVLIMEVKVQHNQNQAISSQAEPATSRECEHMWAQHHSHFQNTHTHKGSANILRFSQFISAVHISICQSMSSPWPRTLQLRIMTQVQTPHSHGSEKFEAYPIHLGQHLIFWSLWSRRRDIIMTSSWHHHILGLCTISLWVVCILGLIKRASAERDLTRLSSSWRWKFNTIKTKQSLHKPNQQPAENVSICELSIIRTFKTLTPTKGQQTFWGFLNSSRPSTYQSAKACHHRVQERCSSESWHRFRRLIPRGRRSLRLTQFISASISFFDHFGAEDVTSSWHHHDIIMTLSHFGTLHHQPMSGVHSWTHQKGLSRTRPDKIVLIMEVKVQHNQNQAISSQAEPATSRECEHMWAQHHSHFLKHSHPHTLTLSLPQCRWDHMCLQIAPTYIFQVGLSWHWYQTNLQAIWVVWVRLQPSFGATFVLTCKTAWRPNGAPPESISSQVGPLGHPEIWRRVGAGKSASFWGHLCFPRPMSLVLGDKKFSLTSRN